MARECLGAPLTPAEQELLGSYYSPVEATLPNDVYAIALEHGRAMSLDDAIKLALSGEKAVWAQQVGGTSGRPVAEPSTSLSRREQEVAVLVARGLTNRQIASELVLSERTVESHVAKILGKLELSSRAQIATWATEQRLLSRN